jgi:hypothetical protein
MVADGHPIVAGVGLPRCSSAAFENSLHILYISLAFFTKKAECPDAQHRAHDQSWPGRPHGGVPPTDLDRQMIDQAGKMSNRHDAEHDA